MDRGFLRSREFAIAGVLAILVLAGGAYAVQNVLLRTSMMEGSFGCETPAEARGLPLAPLSSAQGDSPRHRVVSHALDASAFRAGRLAVCGDYGDVVVNASPNATAEVRFHLYAARDADQEPLDRTDVRVVADRQGDRLALSAWVAEQPVYPLRLGSTTLVTVEIEIVLPAHLAWDLRVEGGSSDVDLVGIRAGDVRVDVHHGRVEARDLDLGGNLTATGATGGVTLDLLSVQSGRILVESTFGDVEMRLPQRADVGYDVQAESTFGDVQVRLGPAESYETTDEGTHVRTAGYDAKPTKVIVEIETGSGDVEVTSTPG